MKVKHDKRADAIYVHLAEGQYARGIDLDERRRVDYDADGHPLGVELLFVSRGVDVSDLPEADAIAEAIGKRHIRVFA